MAKPFFYRIDLIDLMDFATEPVGLSMSLLEFAKELKRGESEHAAIQKIISEAHNYIEKKKLAGRSGGIAKSSSAKAVLESAVAESSIPLASNRSSNRNRNNSSTEQKTEALKPLFEYSNDFQKFWTAYPSKTGKGDAWKSWQKIKPPVEIVLLAINWQICSQKWKDGYIPNPATYINQRRWEDEPPTQVIPAGFASKGVMGALQRSAELRAKASGGNL